MSLYFIECFTALISTVSPAESRLQKSNKVCLSFHRCSKYIGKYISKLVCMMVHCKPELHNNIIQNLHGQQKLAIRSLPNSPLVFWGSVYLRIFGYF